MINKLNGNFLISRYLYMSIEEINKLGPYYWELLVNRLEKELKNK